MDAKNLNNQVEAYLLGTLKSEEKKAFEEQMLKDNALSTAVKEQEVAFEAIDLLVEEDLGAKLKNLQKERYGQARKVKPRQFSFAVAASVALLLLAGSVFFMNNQMSNGNLANVYFEEANDENRGAAVADLEEKIENLKSVTPSAPNYLESQLALGKYYFKNGTNNEAISAFEKILSQPNSLHFDEAKWMSGLSELALGNVTTAKTHFAYFTENQVSGYEKDAQAILNDLGSFWRFGK